MAQLDMPNEDYNWLVDFFSGHAHCTVYCDQTSMLKAINASIIQGSAIGPAAYVVNAGNLQAVTPNNQLIKFTDDTYLVVSASNVDVRFPGLALQSPGCEANWSKNLWFQIEYKIKKWQKSCYRFKWDSLDHQQPVCR